eukprot:TRINITY_DN1369_c0_g1_i2.p2 TRINITY_DN1369_c0_g1~~TRINITY_DN1369_c0_g1_i2.p2  ORF type:complete len:280 (-),score=49.64 TRINITY_DN1369_c0_g1_i2:703-1542(-)
MALVRDILASTLIFFALSSLICAETIQDAVPSCAATGVGLSDTKMKRTKITTPNGAFQANAQLCQGLCQETKDCAHFTWYNDTGGCWLQGDVVTMFQNGNAVSGPAGCEKDGEGQLVETPANYLASAHKLAPAGKLEALATKPSNLRPAPNSGSSAKMPPVEKIVPVGKMAPTVELPSSTQANLTLSEVELGSMKTDAGAYPWCSLVGKAYKDARRNTSVNGDFQKTAKLCQQACKITTFCTFFTWYADTGACWLQGAHATEFEAENAISGPWDYTHQV